ncbi:hypothetical protein AYO39_02635 [Actinobacteria bacterium SCGC AG-212-D09]|nr:hypothetical protein AYO39_02635 [Actinobacteria bacterium SCGC AG-212-D09]
MVSAAVVLVTAGAALAFQPLPSGAQVNDDLAFGINKAISVNGEEPTNADVAGGALTAGKPAVPWAIFRQQETNGAPPPADQVFSRSFAAGAWTTRGSGTVGGRSSASPTFKGSLNFSQLADGEAPSIDFAGAGRTVPWATWYELTTGSNFGNNNIFASRFDNTGDANQGKWIFAGQDRGLGGGTVPIPSLNIHTGRNAENPSVAGGSAVDPTKPGPWITWQETTNAPATASGKDQIFVVRPIGPGSVNCDGVKPAGVLVAGHVPAIGGFCWQQTGIPRVGPGTADPSLNVDPTRNGVEPDITFTGPNDSVPWVVWYELGNTAISGLHNNMLVFAAKAVSDGVTANGGFHWVVVGNALQGTLDTTGTHGFGTCAVSATNEAQCSLNKNPANDAEDPQVAAGTMNSANPTVPWVVWDETFSGVKQVFVSRLVGTGATAHFQIVNGGNAISSGSGSTRADITFSGNTPYVTWRQNINGLEKTVLGHFVNAANPTFVRDEADVPLTPTAQADVREPISSACTANPFNSDGKTCQGGAVGTPFFLFTNGTSPRGLFAGAYFPGAPTTGAASGVTTSSATVAGSVNPLGASAKVFFQFGTTTAYGSVTSAQTIAPANAPVSFSATISSLPSGTTIHYRAVVQTDLATRDGGDRTFTTS